MRITRIVPIVFIGFLFVLIACTSIRPSQPPTPAPTPTPTPAPTTHEVKWSKTFGGTDSKSALAVRQTSDGGFVMVGSVISAASGQNVYIVRTDSLGTMLWDKTYPGRASSIQQTSDGGFIIAGYTLSLGSGFDGLLIKTDASGSMLWSMTYDSGNNEFFYSVQQTSDGGFIMAGYTDHANGDIYLVKTDSMGNVLWSRNLGGKDYESASSVQQTTDGGYILAGSTNSSGFGSIDAYLVKTDTKGNILWSRNLGGKGYDLASSVQQTTDGGYIMAGSTNSSGFGDMDVYLVKTNAVGTMLWSKTFGGPGADEADAVQQTADGGYIIAGGTKFGTGSYDSYIVKVDASGTMLWNKTLDNTSDNSAHSILQTSDGGYIVAGHRISAGTGIKSEIFLVCLTQ